MKDLTKVGGFWKKTNEKGKSFLSGQIEMNGVKSKLLIFPNGYKEHAKQPDYIAYLGETKPEAPKPDDFLDDIPF